MPSATVLAGIANRSAVAAGTDLLLRGEASAAASLTAWVEGVLVDA